MSSEKQQWSQVQAPAYGYPTQPPQGYYNYPPPQAPPPNQQYSQYLAAPQGYNQYGPPTPNYGTGYYAPPPTPQQQGYYQPPPPTQYQSQPPPTSYGTPQGALPQPQVSGETMFSFVRSQHKGWHVHDTQGNLVFDVVYKKASFFHQSGCNVHLGVGGPIVASIFEEVLTMGSQTTPIKRNSKHSNKLTFNDAAGREFSFKEAGKIDYLIAYPSKADVMRGDVNVKHGKGTMNILDPANAPDAAILVAAYVELLRKQGNDEDMRQGGIWGAAGASAGGW